VINQREQEADVVILTATPAEIPPSAEAFGMHEDDMVGIGDAREIREVVLQFCGHL